MRAAAVPELRAARERRRCESAITFLRHGRNPNGRSDSVDRRCRWRILLDAGGGNFAFHADAYGRKASDY
jgi:hypothetical protein